MSTFIVCSTFLAYAATIAQYHFIVKNLCCCFWASCGLHYASSCTVVVMLVCAVGVCGCFRFHILGRHLRQWLGYFLLPL